MFRSFQVEQTAELFHQFTRLQHLRFINQHNGPPAGFLNLQQAIVKLAQKRQSIGRGLGNTELHGDASQYPGGRDA
jgi:hypothetical protein